MSELVNIYCDESCHLQNDHQRVMVLGAVWLPDDKKQEITKRLREIKSEYGLDVNFQVKWTKVSPAQVNFYQALIDYFFDDDDLHFRALIVPDKVSAAGQLFGQEHDRWYYQLYYDMLQALLDPDSRYRIYLDIKDTHGITKVARIKESLWSEFEQNLIERVQGVRAKEIGIMQITDLLTGAIAYVHRGLTSSSAKQKLVQRIAERSKKTLLKRTLPQERKFNLYHWQPKENLQ
jgi:hypothetical protein